MKLRNYSTLFFLILCAISLASCDNDKDDSEYPKTIESQKLLVNGEEPALYLFNTPVLDTVYIINSNETLFQFLNPHLDLNPEIPLTINVDYTKNSVLLVGGGATNGIEKIEQKYIQTDSKKYNLQIDVHLNETTEAPRWAVPIVVPKIDSSVEISVKVEYGKAGI